MRRAFRIYFGVLCSSLVAGALALSPVAGAAGVKPGLAPGAWIGTTHASGTTSTAHGSGSTNESGSILIFVSLNGAVAGDMELAGMANASGGGGSANIKVDSDVGLNGSPQKITWDGELHMTGTASSGSLTVPVDMTLPTTGEFEFASTSCNVASGDLAIEGNETRRASGMSTNLKSPFILYRKSYNLKDKPPDYLLEEAASKLGKEYGDLYSRLIQLTNSPATSIGEYQTALNQLEALFGQASGVDACGANNTQGMRGDTNLHRMFAQALLTLIHNNAISTRDLIKASMLAAQLGLLDPDYAGTNPKARSIPNALEDAFKAKIRAAATAGDKSTLRDIRYAAAQLGMTGIRDAAEREL